MNIPIIGRSMAMESRALAPMGDHLTQTVTFLLPRYYEGLDLAQYGPSLLVEPPEGTPYTQCQGQAQGGAKICTGRKDSVQVGRGQKCYQKYRGAKHERKEQQRIFSSITQIEPSAVTRKEQGNGHQKK